MLGESIRRHRKTDRKPRRRGAATGLRWSRWLLGGFAAIVLGFGTGYIIAVQALFPAPVESFEDAMSVPRLIGQELTVAQAAIDTLGLAVASPVWLPHPDEPAGTVVAQDPLPGQRLRPGTEVRLAVSSGRAQAAVPDVVGLPFETAAQISRRLGFDVNRRNEVEQGPGGLVLRVEPRPGTQRVLPASVTLIVSEEPPEPIFPDSGLVPADTFAVPREPVSPVPDSGAVDRNPVDGAPRGR